MTTKRQKAIAQRRRQGIGPYCRKRTLTPRVIQKAEQVLGTASSELNPDFSYPLPDAIELQPKRGAPPGNTNRLLHGKYAQTSVNLRASVRAHIREARAMIAATRKLLRGEPEAVAWFGDIREVPGDAG